MILMNDMYLRNNSFEDIILVSILLINSIEDISPEGKKSLLVNHNYIVLLMLDKIQRS